MTLPVLNFATLYIAATTLLALRISRSVTDRARNGWFRDGSITIAIGVLCNFLPATSPVMAVLLVFAFLLGTLALSTVIIRRWGQVGSGFAIRLLVIFSCVIGALILMTLPLVLLAWAKNP